MAIVSNEDLDILLQRFIDLKNGIPRGRELTEVQNVDAMILALEELKQYRKCRDTILLTMFQGAEEPKPNPFYIESPNTGI